MWDADGGGKTKEYEGSTHCPRNPTLHLEGKNKSLGGARDCTEQRQLPRSRLRHKTGTELWLIAFRRSISVHSLTASRGLSRELQKYVMSGPSVGGA